MLKQFTLIFIGFVAYLANFPSEAQTNASAIYSNYKDSVFMISNEEENPDSTVITYGTAFAIDKTGHLLTSAHLVKPTSIIKDIKGNFYPILDTVWKNDEHDLAVIKVAGKFRPIPLKLHQEVAEGENVVVIANPSGFQNSVAVGVLSAKREQGKILYLQHTCPISPGSSGGPLFNSRGEVVGVIEGMFAGEHSQNLNFAVPVNYLPAKFMEMNKNQSQPALASSTSENNSSPVLENIFDRLVQRDPLDFEGYVLRCLLKLRLNDLNGAIEDLKVADSLLKANDLKFEKRTFKEASYK